VKVEAEKKRLPRKYMPEVKEVMHPLLLSIAGHCPKNWPQASYLVMKKALLPALLTRR
jgi:hypothetical protein